MNKVDAAKKLPTVSRDGRWSRGQAAVELAIAVPVLALLLLAAGDFARVFFFSIAVNNAARAGAQYGSQSVLNAANEDAMETAATNDGSDVPGLTANATQCTCKTVTPTQTPQSCPASYCTNAPQATYVTVNTSATFSTIVNYPGITSSYALTGKAVMQVQQ